MSRPWSKSVESMEPEERAKAELLCRIMGRVALAKELGVAPTTLRLAIEGHPLTRDTITGIGNGCARVLRMGLLAAVDRTAIAVTSEELAAAMDRVRSRA